MFGEWTELVYATLGLMAVGATVGMLRTLAGYRERILLTHDMAREVQRIRAEYIKRLNRQKQDQIDE